MISCKPPRTAQACLPKTQRLASLSGEKPLLSELVEGLSLTSRCVAAGGATLQICFAWWLLGSNGYLVCNKVSPNAYNCSYRLRPQGPAPGRERAVFRRQSSNYITLSIHSHSPAPRTERIRKCNKLLGKYLKALISKREHGLKEVLKQTEQTPLLFNSGSGQMGPSVSVLSVDGCGLPRPLPIFRH